MRKEVKWFASVMEARLAENDHKGGWKDCDPNWLFRRMIDEAKELAALLEDEHWTYEEMAGEAADIANFAMMIADVTVGAGGGA